MPNKQDNTLYTLIKNLDKKKQKLFIAHLQQSDSKSNFKKMFEVVTTVEFPTDKLVFEKLCKIMKPASFPVTKSNLKNKLIDWLVQTQNFSPFHQLNNKLATIEILCRYKLLKEAEKECDELIQAGTEKELFGFVVQGIYWKTTLHFLNSESLGIEEYIRLSNESTIAAKKWFTSDEAKNLYTAASSQYVKNPTLRSVKSINNVKNLMQLPAFHLDFTNPELSIRTACYTAMAKNYIYQMLGGFSEMYTLDKFVFDKMNKNLSKSLKDMPNELVHSYLNLLNTLIITNRLQEYNDIAKLGHQNLKETPFYDYYLQSIDWQSLHKFVCPYHGSLSEDEDNKLSILYEKLSKDTYSQIAYYLPMNMALICFKNGDYEKSKSFAIEQRNQYEKSKIRMDFQEYAFLIVVLCDFALFIQSKNTFSTFYTVFESYKMFIKRKPIEDDYEVERIFIHHLSLVKENSTRKGIFDVFQKLEDKIIALYMNPSPAQNYISNFISYPLIVSQLKTIV